VSDFVPDEYSIEPVWSDDPALPEGPVHQLIRASAGSGKTYQLTRHYLGLLRRGATVDTILATTFTRKAAGEILGRVITTLAEEAADASRVTPSGEKSARLMLDELTRNLHRVAISTIDSFFHRLGSSFRFELDLPLDPRMVDESSPAATQLRAEAIEAVLADAAASDETFVALLALLRRLHHDQASRSVTRAIDQIVVSHAEVFRQAPDRETWSRLRVKGVLEDKAILDALEGWRAMREHLPMTKAGTLKKNWENSWVKIGQQVKAGDWDTIADSGILAKLLVGEEKFSGTEFSAAWLDAASPFLNHLRGLHVQQIAQQTEATYELMSRFAHRYDELRRQRGVMLYSDLTYRLAAGLPSVSSGNFPPGTSPGSPPGSPGSLGALGSFPDVDRDPAATPFGSDGDGSEKLPAFPEELPGELPELPGAGVLEEVYFRLDQAVTHLLLDEFQDTSLDQWSVLSPFAEEVASTGDGSRSLFVVGDVKQAIYGWRGGCVELFDAVEMLVPLEGRQTLAKSWRSSPVVLEAVNAVFSGIAGCETLCNEPNDAAAAALWSQGFEGHESAKPELPGCVSFEVSALSAVGEEDETPAWASEADAVQGEEDEGGPTTSHERFVAERIKKIHAAMPGRSLGVLVSTNHAVNRLLYELRCAGLPASGEGGNSISDTPAVAAVLSAMRMADHPGDTASGFHTLNSPMGRVLEMEALRESAAVARRLRGALLEQGYAATVAGWVKALAGDCDAAGLLKLSRLVELAERYDAEPSEVLRPGRFVDFVEATRVEEPSSAAIRVMTIHKSKGLEFDAVVLPELDRRLRNVFDVLTDRPDPTGAIEAVYRYAGKQARAASSALAEAYNQRRQRQRQEDLCSLYVAMTRARQGLYLIAKPGVKPDGKPCKAGLSFAGILRDTLGDPDEGCGWGDADWARTQDAADSPGNKTGNENASEEKLSGGVLSVSLESDQPARRLRPTVTPSQLHSGGRVSVEDLMSLETSAAMSRGSAVHEGLEAVRYADDDLASELADSPGLAEVLNHAAVRSALSRRYEDEDEPWRERKFVVVEAERLMKGVFDRVAVGRDADGRVNAAHLIDFKSDRVAAGSAALGERVEAYRPQVEAYRRALSLMLKLEPSAITAELLFTTPGVSVEV